MQGMQFRTFERPLKALVCSNLFEELKDSLTFQHVLSTKGRGYWDIICLNIVA